MTTTTTDEAEVKEFITNWFDKLDAHAPTQDILLLVADEGLVMRLPETTVYGHAGFISWYERIINTFLMRFTPFMPCVLHRAKTQPKWKWFFNGNRIVWSAPQPKSNRKNFFAAQTWELKRSVATNQLQIITYNVDIIPVEGLMICNHSFARYKLSV